MQINRFRLHFGALSSHTPQTLYIPTNKLIHAHASHANCLRAIHCSCVYVCVRVCLCVPSTQSTD